MTDYKILWDTFKQNQISKTGIVEDGALDLATWANQKTKILFYYKETYGYNDSVDISLSTEFKRWIKDKIPTYKKMALLTYMVLETVENGAYFESPVANQSYYKQLYSNDEILISAMSKSAAINISKTSISNNSTKDRLIRVESRKNMEFLRNQLDQLNPTIIICGGRVTADSLLYDTGYLKVNGYKMHDAMSIDDKVIAPYYHLSYGGANYEYIYKCYKQIIHLLKLTK